MIDLDFHGLHHIRIRTNFALFVHIIHQPHRSGYVDDGNKRSEAASGCFVRGKEVPLGNVFLGHNLNHGEVTTLSS